MALSQQSSDLSATTDTNVYSASADKILKIRMVNNTTNPANIRLTLSTVSATRQSTGRIIPDDTVLPALSTMEITGVGIVSGRFLVMYSSIANVNVIVDATSI